MILKMNFVLYEVPRGFTFFSGLTVSVSISKRYESSKSAVPFY